MSSQSIVIKASFKKASRDYSRAKTAAKVAGVAWLGSMLVLASSLIFNALPLLALAIAVFTGAICVLYAIFDWRSETSRWSSTSDSCSLSESCGNDECAPERQGSCATRLGAEREKAILKGELERLSALLERQSIASYLFLGIWALLALGIALKSTNVVSTLASSGLAASSIFETVILNKLKKISSSF